VIYGKAKAVLAQQGREGLLGAPGHLPQETAAVEKAMSKAVACAKEAVEH
jgi:hypothetical protein